MKKTTNILLLIAVLFTLTLTACGSSPSSQGGTAEPKSVATPADPAPEPEENLLGVGGTATIKGIDITLVSITQTKGSGYSTAGDGKVFVLCEFLFENNSSDSLALSSIMCFDAYEDDFSVSYSLGATMLADNSLDGTVDAGKKLKGSIGYEVDETWQVLELQVTPSLMGDTAVFVVQNDGVVME